MDMIMETMGKTSGEETKEDKSMEDQRKEIENREDDEMEIDLVLLFGAFWKSFTRLWWLVLILILAGAGGFYAFQNLRYEPLYASSATFTVATGDGESGTYNFYYNSNTADQMSRTFPYILDSSFFRSALLERLGTDTLNGTITSETVENSNMVTMRVESPDPEDAREILDTALEIYPETARFVLGDIQFNYLNEPEPPTEPFNHIGLRRTLALGGGAGALAGILILGLTALFRRTARNPEEMQKITSLRCLAMIPQVRFKARKKQKKKKISVLDKRLSFGYRESLRALEIRLENMMAKEGGKVLLISSTASGEGKSTLAVNLSELLASRGKRVLLIDGDLRKQDDAGIIGIRDGAGLADIVKGEKTIREGLRKLKKSGIWFLGSRRIVKQPASVLSSPRTGELIQALKKEMDYIIIDTPPCEMFQDAGMLSDYADGILYVVKYDFIPQRRIWEGLSFLGGRSARILGYVFNSYPESVSEYGYGRYGYGRYGRYGYGKYGYGGGSYRQPYGQKNAYEEEEAENG